MDTTTPIPPDEVAEEISETLQTISQMDIASLWASIRQFFVDALPTLFTALILFIVGFFLIRLALKCTQRLLDRSKADPALSQFVMSVFRISLYIVLAVVVLSILLPSAVSGMIAALSIFGLAVSLAVKDSLANLAGGISVLFTKPFGLGDFVMIDALEGTVREIRLNYTVLSTIDNKTIHIPNGDVSKAKITNYTSQTYRRLDLDFHIGYQNDFEAAKKLILSLLDAHPMVVHEPDPIVRVFELGNSSMIIGCRVWVSTPDYWTLKFDLLEQAKAAFDQAGISIPYNQLEVTMKDPQRH